MKSRNIHKLLSELKIVRSERRYGMFPTKYAARALNKGMRRDAKAALSRLADGIPTPRRETVGPIAYASATHTGHLVRVNIRRG